jgi:carbon-monoxide dehydrogenase medium subunit
MYSAEFDYFRAASVAEASDLLRQNPGAKVLAGGHSLIPLLKLRLAAPSALIDIGRIAELRGVSVTNGVVRLGALTTHAELASSPVLKQSCPVLAEAAQLVGDPAVRNRGTIGGNVAHADPASDLPPVLLALGARFEIMGPAGRRVVEASDFFTGMMETALAPEEVLVAVELPVVPKQQGTAYVKFDHPASRFAVIGVSALLTMAGGKCTAASVALGGLVPKPIRAAAVEKALAGATLSGDAITKAAGEVARDLGDEVLGDIYASADYRKAMAPVWVGRALTTAARRAA